MKEEITICKLRPWTLADKDALTVYANNPLIAQNMMDQFPHPFTEEKAIQFIERVSSTSIPNILAIAVDNKVVGSIGIHPLHDIERINAELGYWLAEPYWGKGIMTEAIRQMVAYGFANFEIQRIFARPFGHNYGSQKALEKAGFILEAKFEKTFIKNGQLIDEWIYGMRRPD